MSLYFRQKLRKQNDQNKFTELGKKRFSSQFFYEEKKKKKEEKEKGGIIETGEKEREIGRYERNDGKI